MSQPLATSTLQRKIIHIDMDAFFASVEQRDNPELMGKPVAVGGSKERGVVATASYEARKYGVFSAMSSVLAARKCPELIFVKPRFDAYKEASRQIHQIFQDYTDIIEPLSLDEAYLDVTSNKRGINSATIIAKEIKARIKAETKLTASAGVSYNKFLAKMASDLKKPDGLSVILPEEAISFIQRLPVKKFYGIGTVTAEKLHKMGIFIGKDLEALSMVRLQDVFGKSAAYFHDLVRGIDNRRVNPSHERKSIGAENTFPHDLTKQDAVIEALETLLDEVWRRLMKSNKCPRTLTVKIKTDDFKVSTRSKTNPNYLHTKEDGHFLLQQLLPEVESINAPIRLLGVSVSNFQDEEQAPSTPDQLTLGF